MEYRFSDYGRAACVPSPVNRMMTQFAGDFRDGVDINLGVGYINEGTIPVDAMLQSLGAVTRDPMRHRQPYNYCSSDGVANLKDAIVRFLARERMGGLSERDLHERQLIIGASGATSLLDALADVLQPGIVVTADPYYYIYCDALQRKGYTILAIPEDGEGIDCDALEEALAGIDTGGLAFFYLVTVNNPSCVMLSNRRRRRVVEIARRLSLQQGRLIPVVFDQAYEWLLHDPQAERFESMLPGDDLGIVHEVGTLSKIFAPALRLGYMIGRPGALMTALIQRTSDGALCNSALIQETASLLLDEHIGGQLRRVNAAYREKALRVGEAIRSQLGPWLESFSGGSAGFYFYLTFRTIETHEQSAFFRHLTRTTGDPAIDGPAGERRPRVIYVPGEHCVHRGGRMVERGQRQLRLSYGYEDVETIVRGLALMREAAEAAVASG